MAMNIPGGNMEVGVRLVYAGVVSCLSSAYCPWRSKHHAKYKLGYLQPTFNKVDSEKANRSLYNFSLLNTEQSRDYSSELIHSNMP
jgi:hypothetical protein